MLGINDAAIFIIQTLGSLYLLIVLMRFVLQLVRANFYNPLCQFIVKATQPLLKPLRRIIPSLASYLCMSAVVRRTRSCTACLLIPSLSAISLKDRFS